MVMPAAQKVGMGKDHTGFCKTNVFAEENTENNPNEMWYQVK